jgi:multimeric flavodoxin WrbA
MHVIAVNGSPKRNGNTYQLLKLACDELNAAGVTTEIIHLAPLKLQPCNACFQCAETRDKKCHGVKDDGLNDLLPRVFGADGLLIGSPTWFANVTGHVKNFIDRVGIVNRANDEPLSRLVGAAVVAVRRAGALPVFDAINHFFLINAMIVPGSSYWNLGIGRTPGEVLNDEEGKQTLINLGRNMAWLLGKLAAQDLGTHG